MSNVDPSWLVQHFGMTRLPVESTLYASTYRSARRTSEGRHAGTAIVGLLCVDPPSRALFHRVPDDEVWHFYGGDPLRLVLLHGDGSAEEVVLGPDLRAGHRVQHVVPGDVWQAAEVVPGGAWSLFGCTMAPGFTGELFESGYAAPLLAAYPDRRSDIERLAVPDSAPRAMPTGFV